MLRAARERRGEPDHRHAGREPRRGVGRERVLDRALLENRPRRRDGHPPAFRIQEEPGRPSSASTSTTASSSRTPCPGLPERAATEGLTPLEYMRRYGSFEVQPRSRRAARRARARRRSSTTCASTSSAASTRARAKPAGANIVPFPTPDPDADGRRLGRRRDRRRVAARVSHAERAARVLFARRSTDWGWPEYALPTYIRSHVHPERLEDGQMPLIPTFRLPVQIHTRSANAKWLDEIAHTNPLWIHPRDAERLALRTGALVRVETEIGYFVVKAWVTEGIRPGIVACSHHMGRWKLDGEGQRQLMATVALAREGGRCQSAPQGRRGAVSTVVRPGHAADLVDRRRRPPEPRPSPCIPIRSPGMHCWHQAVRVKQRRGRRFVRRRLRRRRQGP